MEIQRWFYYIFIVNCVLIQNLETRTVSLNEIIAAESQLKDIVDATSSPALQSIFEVSEAPKTQYSPIKRLASKINRSKAKRKVAPQEASKFLAPLAYKNKFKITSPLRPKKFKVGQNLRFKRKNQATKREIKTIGNETLKEKYIPLLKSLSMLFDNLLDSDGDGSNEIKTKKHKRNRYYSPELFDVPWNCTNKCDSMDAEYGQEKKATASPKSFATKIPAKVDFTITEASSTPPLTIATRNFGTFRRHKNIPLLFSRNTISSRRANIRNSKGSSSTLHRNVQRDISGDHGNYEHNSGEKKHSSSENGDEKVSFSFARDHTSRSKHRGTVRDGNVIGNTKHRNFQTKTNESKTKITDDTTTENQFETGRVEKESPKFISNSFGGIRRSIRDNEVSNHSKRLQPKEIRKEGDNIVSNNVTSDTRITVGSSTVSTKIQEIRTGDEGTIIIGNETMVEDSSNASKQTKKMSPVVMIFDGYSVTRHKNGENKLSEKSIRIHA